jgi:hypothetical protein
MSSWDFSFESVDERPHSLTPSPEWERTVFSKKGSLGEGGMHPEFTLHYAGILNCGWIFPADCSPFSPRL